MRNYPIESILRPAVELHLVITLAAVALLIAFFPGTFMMTVFQSQLWVSGLLVLSLFYGFSGYRILRYRSRLVQLPYWPMDCADVKGPDHGLILGRGFYWRQKHTQRLFDTRKDQNQHYLTPNIFYKFARRLADQYRFWEFLNATSRLNPVRPRTDLGGDPCLHGVGLYEFFAEQSIFVSHQDRQGNMLVVGTPGVGKTRAASYWIGQDIARGDCVIVLDPKGDFELLQSMFVAAEEAERLGDFYMFHLGHPEVSDKYNPLGSFGRITEVASRIRSQLPDQGNSATFAEFCWRYLNGVNRALFSLGRVINPRVVLKLSQQIDPLVIDYLKKICSEKYAGWESELERLKDEDPSSFSKGIKNAMNRDQELGLLIHMVQERELTDETAEALITTVTYDQQRYSMLIASLFPLLEKLCTGAPGELLSPDFDPADQRRTFEWQKIIRSKSIVYVGLDALTDAVVSGAVGSSMFADLTSLAGHIYKHGLDFGLPGESEKVRVQIHADEFAEIVGDEFIQLLNKARGAGFFTTAYTQSLADIIVGLENREKGLQAIDNFNTTIAMRVKSVHTAEVLTSLVPEVEIQEIMLESGSSGAARSGDFKFSTNVRDRLTSTRQPAITPPDVASLGKGQAYALIKGNQPVKIRIPHLQVGNSAPKDIYELVDLLRAGDDSESKKSDHPAFWVGSDDEEDQAA